MAPLSSMMNSIQGPVSQEEKLHERRSADKEEPPNNDKAAVKGCKSKALSLPFSVESLISDRTTTRTLYTSSESGIRSPTSATDERLRLSPMALYADRKIPMESVTNLSDSKRGDMEELSNKGQSSWFQTPSYASPPSKCIEFRTQSVICHFYAMTHDNYKETQAWLPSISYLLNQVHLKTMRVEIFCMKIIML